VEIRGKGTVEYKMASNENVYLAADTAGIEAGTVKLGASALYTGTISSFGSGDHIIFADMNFATSVFSFEADPSGHSGKVHVTDGSRSAHVSITGDQTLIGHLGIANDGFGHVDLHWLV
jgi:hypothetical protein